MITICKPPQEGQGGILLYHTKNAFTVQQCDLNPEKIYVFNDNLDRHGDSLETRIRKLPNSFGLRTKKDSGSVLSSYFYDSDFLWFTKIVLEDMEKLQELNKTKTIVFNGKGYGNGASKLHTNAPRCYKYLVNHLNTFCGVNYFGE